MAQMAQTWHRVRKARPGACARGEKYINMEAGGVNGYALGAYLHFRQTSFSRGAPEKNARTLSSVVWAMA
jgi:hypothetical protein